MGNRLPEDQEPMDEKQRRLQEEVQRRINAIMEHASYIYDLMEPGMTVSVSLEDPQSLIVPGRPPQIKKLLITRPMMLLEIQG